MVDQNSQFFAILTNVGAAKQANADALGIPWKITQMGVGDANGADPTPSAAQTRLINEWRRAPLNLLKVDDKDASVIVVEQVIPADVGGHWIREIALYDADGDMVAVANCAPTYKPLLSQGSGRTQVVRMNLVVSSASNVQLKIDPSVVLATREYVDTAILNVLPKNKAAGTYTKVTIDERGIVLQGASPTTLAGFGIQDVYTKTATDGLLSSKANSQDVYSKTHIDSALSGKANKSTTLAEYGITDALHTGATNQHPVFYANTPGLGLENCVLEVREVGLIGATSRDFSYAPRLAFHWGGVTFGHLAMDAAGTLAWNGSRVYTEANFNAAPLSQATESNQGTAKIATIDQVIGGGDDSVAVTPRKLRWGFSMNFAQNGYIAFPSWLGAFIIQWAYSEESGSANDYRYFPIAYPHGPLAAFIQLSNQTTAGFGGNNGTVLGMVDNSRYLWSVGGTWGGGGFGWVLSVGW